MGLTDSQAIVEVAKIVDEFVKATTVHMRPARRGEETRPTDRAYLDRIEQVIRHWEA